MNREILFKAKRIDNGEWVEGSLISFDVDSGYVYIVAPYPYASTLPVKTLIGDQMYLVDTETVCQYTGLTDKNGEKIFESDCLNCRENVVKYACGIFTINGDRLLISFSNDYEIIGNIFDNPELLKEGAE